MSIVDRLRYTVSARSLSEAPPAWRGGGQGGRRTRRRSHRADYAPVDFKVAQSVKVDLRDPASIDAALKQVEGPIHAVFSAAGVADGTTDLLKINFIGHRHLSTGYSKRTNFRTARRSASSPRSPAWAGRTTWT